MARHARRGGAFSPEVAFVPQATFHVNGMSARAGGVVALGDTSFGPQAHGFEWRFLEGHTARVSTTDRGSTEIQYQARWRF